MHGPNLGSQCCNRWCDPLRWVSFNGALCGGLCVSSVCLLCVRSVLNFWCECVQCLRGGVRFPNEVGVWWPSVYGGPNPKALHFQPWVGLGL